MRTCTHTQASSIGKAHTHAHTHTHTHAHTQAPFVGKAPVPDGWQPMFGVDDDRKFRGGFVSPFSANIGVMLYKKRHANDTG